MIGPVESLKLMSLCVREVLEVERLRDIRSFDRSYRTLIVEH